MRGTKDSRKVEPKWKRLVSVSRRLRVECGALWWQQASIACRDGNWQGRLELTGTQDLDEELAVGKFIPLHADTDPHAQGS